MKEVTKSTNLSPLLVCHMMESSGSKLIFKKKSEIIQSFSLSIIWWRAVIPKFYNHFLKGGMYVHAKGLVDKVAGGIKHEPSHTIGSSTEQANFIK